jgi:hypothetical protein
VNYTSKPPKTHRLNKSKSVDSSDDDLLGGSHDEDDKAELAELLKGFVGPRITPTTTHVGNQDAQAPKKKR